MSAAADRAPGGPAGPLDRLPAAARWGLLLAGSVGLAAPLRWAGLPAALMLGPMFAAIGLAAGGVPVRVPAWAGFAAQASIGCLVARSITPATCGTILRQGPILVGVVAATVLLSAALGWLMGRLRIIPGTTAVWGLCPGAASVMTLMAEAYGADARLVAFLQYLRVVLVAATAALVAHVFAAPGGGGGGVAAEPGWFPPVRPADLAATVLVAAGGGLVGARLGVPAGVLLVPMAAGAALQATGLTRIELPPAPLAAAYAVFGWRIGLGFTPAVLRHSARILPQVLLAIATLIAVGGGLAALLNRALGIDPLTAYLATSPGGMDSIAIIAASGRVDLPFVMALQTMRFLVILGVGPALARTVARSLARAQDAAGRPGG